LGGRYAWRSETAPSYPWRNQWTQFTDDAAANWPEVKAMLAPKLDTLGFAPSGGNIVRDNVYATGGAYAPGFSKDAGGGAPNVIEGTRIAGEAEWRAEVGPIGLAAHNATAIYAALGLKA